MVTVVLLSKPIKTTWVKTSNNTTGRMLFVGAKSKTNHLPIKRDRRRLTVYTLSPQFYGDSGNWTGMN